MKQLFTANLNNEVVAFAASLEDFVQIIHEVLPTSKHYTVDDFFRKFEENSIWLHPIGDDDIYGFQEVF